MSKKSDKQEIYRLIEFLSANKHRFSKENNREKLSAFKALSGKDILDPKALFDYHEILCFMQAYPADAETIKLVDEELARFPDRIARYREVHGEDDDRIEDLGMADTSIFYPYSYHMARWLLRNYGPEADLNWDDYNEKEDDPLSGLLSIFAQQMENDGVDDENLTSAEWIDFALAPDQTPLEWLLRRFEQTGIPTNVKQHLYDSAELGLTWNLGRSKACRTLAKEQPQSIYFQKSDLKKQKLDLRETPEKPKPKLRRLSAADGMKVLDRLICALLPRHRELYPATFANVHEVYETSPGYGLNIYILGMRPEDRMPLETNYSALLIKNGVPIGYGIGVLFFERCEIAINVFDTFRSGEASIIFDHFFRVFYHLFGARALIMRRWQVGHENEEGLQSGSFWFYYKLGFRSNDPEIDEIAHAEAMKIARDKSYRCDLRTLKKLALSDMVIDFTPNAVKPYVELQVTDIGVAVTRNIAADFGGDGEKARISLSRQVAKALGISGLSKWSPLAGTRFGEWSLLLGMIPDLEHWSKEDKSKLISLIKAKADILETVYVNGLQKHKRLRRALVELAVSGEH